MLHQDLVAKQSTTLPQPFLREGAYFTELLLSARAALDHDLSSAQHYLDRMVALLGQTASDQHHDDRILPPFVLSDIDQSPTKGGLAPWQLRRVMAYINEHLSGPIFIEALARLVRLSGGHFCRAFKASVGDTPHNFLVRERIRRAQTLMLNTNDTLSQIACACGLTDQAHLTRLFRKFVGDTPLIWRRTWQTA